jgi:hypothetical protein
MKRKSALLMIICLFFGAASIQLSAQVFIENEVFQGWYEWSYVTPVFCEGEDPVVLSFDFKAHYVVHVKDDVVVFHKEQLKGTATSDTGEKFKYKETDTYINDFLIFIRFNAKGDKGSQYMGTMLVDISGGSGGEVFIPLSTKCK